MVVTGREPFLKTDCQLRQLHAHRFRKSPSMASSLEFEVPHAGLQDSYRDLIREFIANQESLVPFVLGFPNQDFTAFLDHLTACARGESLPVGFVAHSTYWIVRDGMVVGVSNLRHALTEKLRREGGNIGYGVRPSARGQGIATELLRHTLIRASEIGLQKVLITCSQDNPASARTIIKNGGRLDSEEFLPERSEVEQRYWIHLNPIRSSNSP